MHADKTTKTESDKQKYTIKVFLYNSQSGQITLANRLW